MGITHREKTLRAECLKDRRVIRVDVAEAERAYGSADGKLIQGSARGVLDRIKDHTARTIYVKEIHREVVRLRKGIRHAVPVDLAPTGCKASTNPIVCSAKVGSELIDYCLERCRVGSRSLPYDRCGRDKACR